MNNKFIAFSVAITFFSIIACTNKTIYSNSGTKKQSDKTLTDTLWHLKNRIPNCDSAIVFMGHVIVPVESFPKNDKLFPRERETIVTIPGEGTGLQEEEKYKFYINPDCLVGKRAEIALEIFCLKDSLESFIVLDKKYQAQDTYWVLSARGFGNYLSIRFEKGLVSGAVFNTVSKSH
jgi:hypothetical protein